MSSHKERLIAFYQKYNPEKLSGVDATLEKFKGREEDMFKALVGKYGPEPGAATSTATASSPSSSTNFKERLTAYYQKYNPEKLPGVDATLEKFKGREEDMFKALIAKYGPEPTSSYSPTAPPLQQSQQPSLVVSSSSVPNTGASSPNVNYKDRLIAYYKKYNPEKLAGVDATLDKFKGREEEMFKALVGKYGPEPTVATSGGGESSPKSSSPSSSSYRDRLVAFYQKYNPEKMNGVDATLEKFKGREEEMFKALTTKYGPEPTAASGDNNNNATSSTTPPATTGLSAPPPPPPAASNTDYYTRLSNFYKKYNPQKLAGVEATLEKFKGREEDMFKSLVAKYGAEPTTGGSTTTPTQSNLTPASQNNTNTAPSSFKDRLIAFYQKYNPDKMSGVDATLEKFKGREEEMFKALIAKYGPEPTPTAAAATTTNSTNDNQSFSGPSSSSSAPSSYRDRLVAFYQKYNPDKMNGVDATLEKFKGREEEMFKALVGKYGPEPAATSSSENNNKTPSGTNTPVTGNLTSPNTASSSSYRDRLIGFYKKYNPDKMSGVDATLEKFKGREEEMFKALVNKYGAEPSPISSPNNNRSLSVPPQQQQQSSNGDNNNNTGNEEGGSENTLKSRLTRFYQKYAPEKLAKVDSHLAKYAGREDEFFKALVNSYGPEPPSTPSPSNLQNPPTQQQQQQQPYTTKQRLTAFYQKYAPDKVAKVDDHLTKYAGREEELFKALVAKYGAEPPQPSSSNQQLQQPLSPKQRLIAFYQKYAPDKISKVDDQLKKYEGREEEFMKALVTKYGPEPIKSPVQSPNQTGLPTPPKTRSTSTVKSPSEKPLFEENHDDDMQRSNSNNNAAAPKSSSNNKNNNNNGITPATILQITQLPPDQAQQRLKELASKPEFLSILQNSLTGKVVLGAEGKIKALSEEEAERREIIDQVQMDEFEILSHMASTAFNKIKSSEESEQLQQKTNDLLRKQHMELWMQFAKDRIKQRRREANAALTPYQRIAFSKSKAGLLSLQKDSTSPSSPLSPGSPGRRQPLVKNYTIAAPVPMQSNQLRRANSSGISTSRATPRAGNGSFRNNNNNTTLRTASSSNSFTTPRTAGMTTMRAASTTSANSTSSSNSAEVLVLNGSLYLLLFLVSPPSTAVLL